MNAAVKILLPFGPAQMSGAAIVSAAAVVVLCAAAALGTVLLLPGTREAAIRKIGGGVLLAAGAVLAALVARGSAADPAGPFFWMFSALAIAGAVRVVSHTVPVYSALYFLLTTLATAGLLVLLWAEFLAAALVLIYAGAILVTYVFVIMLAARVQAECDTHSREPVLASAACFALLGMLLVVIFQRPAVSRGEPAQTAADATPALAQELFGNHVVAVEVAGVLLAVAVAGAVIMGRRGAPPLAPLAPATRQIIGDDNPHNIPVYGADSARRPGA